MYLCSVVCVRAPVSDCVYVHVRVVFVSVFLTSRSEASVYVKFDCCCGERRYVRAPLSLFVCLCACVCVCVPVCVYVCECGVWKMSLYLCVCVACVIVHVVCVGACVSMFVLIDLRHFGVLFVGTLHARAHTHTHTNTHAHTRVADTKLKLIWLAKVFV